MGTCFSTVSSQASIAGQSSLCTSMRAAGKGPARSKTRPCACQDCRCLYDRAGNPTIEGIPAALTSSRKASKIVLSNFWCTRRCKGVWQHLVMQHFQPHLYEHSLTCYPAAP